MAQSGSALSVEGLARGARPGDRAERPVSISGGASGSFTYDAHGRRVKQVVGGQTIYSVYSASGTLLYRDNATTSTATDYIRMGGRAIARVRGSDVEWTYADHLGSPAAAASQTGAILWREDHAPFGLARQAPAGNADNEGFTGHIADAASGLVYMQARYYDPVVGRFLSSDPVGFAAGGPAYFNRYAYTANDPVNMIDPDGETQEWVYVQTTGSLEHHQPPDALPPVDSSLAGSEEWASRAGSITPNDAEISQIGQWRQEGGWTIRQVAVGYAGSGEGLNNPQMESVRNVGPLPQGEYALGRTYDSTVAGPASIALDPAPSTNMHGRSAMLIHGDNPHGNRSASNGCIIAPRAVRNEISDSPDRVLRVVPN